MSEAEQLRIRRAQPGDGAIIHELVLELARYERAEGAVEACAERYDEQLGAERPPFECLLAEETSGAALGFALFFPNFSTWRGRPGLYLEDLFVRPAARGRGVGRALFQRLRGLAEERGYGRMDWSVLKWNEPAIGFYRALGAQEMSGWAGWRIDLRGSE